jgi:hypothetical protein
VPVVALLSSTAAQSRAAICPGSPVSLLSAETGDQSRGGQDHIRDKMGWPGGILEEVAVGASQGDTLLGAHL